MPSLYTSRGDEPIFQQEKLNDILILTMIEDPAAANYASKQHEYNRLFQLLDSSEVSHLLFDLHRCRILDSVTIGILVPLTGRCRDNGHNVVLSGLTEDVNGMLARLMLLQHDKQRTMWQTYATREEAVVALNTVSPA
ncbi:MAG: STAS domain-containing protein [Planctomycetaceae bacterium]